MKHIIILYKRFESHILELFAGFFRFCGIYVLEYVLEDVWHIKGNEIISKSDFALALNADDHDKSLLEGFEDRLILLKCKSVDFNIKEEKKSFSILLMDLLERMKKKGFDNFDSEIMGELIRQYVDKELMYDNFQIRLLFDKCRLGDMVKNFSEAVEAVSKDMLENCRYAFYFSFECKRKANIACRIGERSRKYSSEAVFCEIRKYLKEHPDYTELYALCGMFADEDINYVTDAEYYYERALSPTDSEQYKVDDERILGYNYYRLARYYEKVRKNNEKATWYYWKAYEADRTNYRFTYKVAFMYELEEKWERAEAYYRKILDEMEPYFEKNYLQPSQCEYAFKVYFRLMLIYKSRMGQLRLADWMGNRAVDLNGKIADNLFFEAFYRTEEEVQTFKGLMKKRLQVESVKEQLEDIKLLNRRFLF